ncbi:MAG: hypothetical protein AAGA31_02450, partial [Bacteroidota bacterium]
MSHRPHKPLTTKIRHYAEDVRTSITKRKDLRRYGIAYYNFWEVGPVAQSWFYRFLQRPALRGMAKNKPVAFFSVFGRKRLLQLCGTERRVFFTGEDLARFPEYQNLSKDEVTLSLGFNLQERGNYLRFPLWLLDFFSPTATQEGIAARINKLEAVANDF